MHGNRRAKSSEYGQQLREKQKVKRVYGIMETPFRNLFDKAVRERGITSEVFFGKLEKRLDNVVYRMGFAASRQEAKQVVRHNHILVNGKKVNIPSAELAVGDTVSIKDSSRELQVVKNAVDHYQKRPALRWVEVDHTKFVGKITAEPTRDDVGIAVKDRLIVELFSK
jgi:small subunit ribosomal protein S4